MVAGHPFKGGDLRSTGMLLNPEVAFFAINTPLLFTPPNPMKTWNSEAAAPAAPSFSDFFSAYFGNSSYNMSSPAAGKMLEGLKKCYENHPQEPVDSCQYYLNGFRRLAFQ